MFALVHALAFAMRLHPQSCPLTIAGCFTPISHRSTFQHFAAASGREISANGVLVFGMCCIVGGGGWGVFVCAQVPYSSQIEAVSSPINPIGVRGELGSLWVAEDFACKSTIRDLSMDPWRGVTGWSLCCQVLFSQRFHLDRTGIEPGTSVFEVKYFAD